MSCHSSTCELINSTDSDSAEGDSINKMQRQTSREFSFSRIGNQLQNQRDLHVKRKIISDLSLGFALLGIITMILTFELRFIEIRNFDVTIYFLKVLLDILTYILIILIVVYHIIDIRVFMIDNYLKDCRVAVTSSRVGQVLLEIFICYIHPLSFEVSYSSNVELMNDIFGLLMFARLYLIGRTIVLHSWINENIWTLSLGPMNRTTFHYIFVLKSAMNLYPVSIILFMTIFLFVWSSWAVRICEINFTNGVFKLTDSMWLVAITFLGVGYGDIVPVSFCGRVIAVMTGIFGAGITALTVVMVSKKLEFSSSESHVHYFMMRSKLNYSLKIAAANIVKRAWLLYKNRTISRSFLPSCKRNNSQSVLYCERKLFQAIFDIRDIKKRLKQVTEESAEINESRKLFHNLQVNIFDLQDKLLTMEATLKELNENMKRFMRNEVE